VRPARRVLVIDNYDSFVYNLVQMLGALGADPIVRRNDEIDPDGAADLGPDLLLVSPGPGRPEEAGASLAVMRRLQPTTPILGVCLGHQCLAALEGAEIVRAPTIMHGKTSEIHHDGTGLFTGLTSPTVATRYHSLVVEPTRLPSTLRVNATTADGVIMGIVHRRWPSHGVQFHPESVLSPDGRAIVARFLTLEGPRRSPLDPARH
jgi:anthranilate synthase/aminodeoxychorismate synthase-like glutamine amidotransferase